MLGLHSYRIVDLTVCVYVRDNMCIASRCEAVHGWDVLNS